VARSNWFGGVYRDPKNFFAQFAVSDNYLDLYPEFIVPPSSAPITSATAAARWSAGSWPTCFKVGDVIPLKGTIYPGTWDFVVRGIMDGRDESTITRQMVFHWDYLNETVRKKTPARPTRWACSCSASTIRTTPRPSRAPSTTCSRTRWPRR
jgi:putative ABC transport system permease protein